MPGTSSRLAAPGGFSMIEAVIATALTIAIGAIVLSAVDLARARFAVQPEAADLQQRVRVAAGALRSDLLMAGAGVTRGANMGPLVQYLAPVLPYRVGTSHDDPPGTFTTDTITLMYVPSTVAQTTLAAAAPETISIDRGPGCPAADAACGFRGGMTMLVHDGSGRYDTFIVTAVQPSGLDVARTSDVLAYTAYAPATTTVAELVNVVYFLKTDATTGVSQLAASGSAISSDVPVVDHVVGLRFDYYGAPDPPALTGDPPGNPARPATTYGPAPPALLEQLSTAGYPAGENCIFTLDATGEHQIPRLPTLDAGSAAGGLVLLTAEQLTDGPWCPDAASANRWDADLLRIRTIGVTLRIEAADAAMRGPAGLLFSNGGIGRNSVRWLPDQTVRFQVTPWNLRQAGR
jgi:hypothetical protein